MHRSSLRWLVATAVAMATINAEAGAWPGHCGEFYGRLDYGGCGGSYGKAVYPCHPCRPCVGGAGSVGWRRLPYAPPSFDCRSAPSPAPLSDDNRRSRPPGLPPGGDFEDAPPAPPSTSVESDSGLLKVATPPGAKILVNGYQTKSEGEGREFIAHDLKPGFLYTFNVRATVERDGETVEQTKTVGLTAGKTAYIAFDFPMTSSEPAPVTSLTVTAPEDAVILLGGNPTSATGKVRLFETTQLASGNRWQDYKVQARVMRDGRALVQEKTITLGAGDKRSLTFDFDDDADTASSP